MQALIYYGPEKLTIEEMDVPACGHNEVLIEVESVGICGSELEGYLGHSSIRKPPLVMGHEFCGRVAATGELVRGLSTEDKVVVNPLISCRACASCLAGKINVCRNRNIVGIHRPGAFAQFVAVPASNVYRIPEEMDASLASLAEPLAVSIHGVKRGLRPLDDLLIFGAGPIGLLSLMAARHMGAGNITVVDLQPARLEHAQRLGAIVMTPDQLEERRNEGFPQGIPTIIDCVGVQATREQAMTLINPDGTIVMVGLGHDRSALPVNHLVRQEISLIGSYTYSHEDIQQAIALLEQGKIDVQGWTEIRDLTEGPAAFQELAQGKSSFSKIFLKP
ncbi:zinc-dependent alcohol dehydrogenase [Cohnella silvisoli]|uniref:Alcohol dehydrogenase catalytic domain-containing protein n=1 Tax=Cohnella silvisoli TaxID=2873699 RepID=A0ABV1KUH1_9BACL|nr:alcohol dehydrogenase catalytic domain-containing protein [Cohnella silvisoli]MCD9023067.1 alcohol dehydrogenase catalytic domain-containing protein [Cohnella silvisoli]